MLIQAPEYFDHVGRLPSGLLQMDPRRTSPSERVAVDLRYCAFVRPPAVLWCLIYGLLVRRSGQEFELVVPESVGVARYLKALGLFDLLRASGAIVDDRGIVPSPADQIGVPLRQFASDADVQAMADEAAERLGNTGLGAANIRGTVVEMFAELAANAVQHSESPVGSFGMVQYYASDEGGRFICAVADGGIGIRESLLRNPQLRDRIFYDWAAIELALQERVSGTGSPSRGIGLYYIAEEMRKPGRRLLFHSGIGVVERSEEQETNARRATLFPGTLAFASIAS